MSSTDDLMAENSARICRGWWAGIALLKRQATAGRLTDRQRELILSVRPAPRTPPGASPR